MITTINMYLLIEIKHYIHIYNAMGFSLRLKIFNDILEILINSSHIILGDFWGLGVQMTPWHPAG